MRTPAYTIRAPEPRSEAPHWDSAAPREARRTATRAQRDVKEFKESGPGPVWHPCCVSSDREGVCLVVRLQGYGAVVLVAAAVCAHPLGAAASDPRPGEGRDVQIEEASRVASMRGPSVTGYVRNNTLYRIGNVRLRVEATDPLGRRLPPAFGWVYGDVEAGGRTSFSIPLPASAATYEIAVESFDLLSRESP